MYTTHYVETNNLTPYQQTSTRKMQDEKQSPSAADRGMDSTHPHSPGRDRRQLWDTCKHDSLLAYTYADRVCDKSW